MIRIGDKIVLSEDYDKMSMNVNVTNHLKQFEGEILTVKETYGNGDRSLKFEEDTHDGGSYYYKEKRFKKYEQFDELGEELFLI